MEFAIKNFIRKPLPHPHIYTFTVAVIVFVFSLSFSSLFSWLLESYTLYKTIPNPHPKLFTVLTLRENNPY